MIVGNYTHSYNMFLNLNTDSNTGIYDVEDTNIASTLEKLKNIYISSTTPSYLNKETTIWNEVAECAKRAALPFLFTAFIVGATSGDIPDVSQSTIRTVNAAYHLHESRQYIDSTYAEQYVWLAEAVNLDSIGKMDGALDIVYNKLDDLLLQGQYTKVDHFLKQLVAANYSPNLLLGILTVTFYASEHLPSRAEFLEKTVAVFEENHLPVSVYLDGLRFS